MANAPKTIQDAAAEWAATLATPGQPQQAPQQPTPQAPPMAENPNTGDPNVDAMALAVPLTPEEQAASAVPPSKSGAVMQDIGKGITELPRAVVKGVRDAAQGTLNTAFDILGTAGTGVPPQDASIVPGTEGLSVGGANVTSAEAPLERKAPQLPDLNKPESVTGQFAASISQFAAGMIGLGKITAGYSAATRAGKFALEAAKAATVGAVAFDPHGPRIADLIETIPGLSNPATQWLSSKSTDTAAMGRMKNALESLGMDAVITGPLLMGIQLYRASRGVREGAIKKEELATLIQQAEANQAKAEREAVTKAQRAAAGPERDILDISTEARIKQGISVPDVPTDVTENILKAMREDVDALAKHGDWATAINAGHAFSTIKATVPWNKFANMPDELAAFTMRVSEQIQSQVNKVRGGGESGIMSDAQIRMMVGQRSALWNEDPAALMSMLQQAGKGARSLAANMEAAFLVSQKAHQDTFAMASRIMLGDFDAFGGSKEAAMQALHGMVGVVTDSFAQAQAMRAAAGRTLRRNREEFAVSQDLVNSLKGLSPEMLVDTIVAAGANPKNLKIITEKGFWQRIQDPVQYLLVNNLLWSPVTHGVNMMTNIYNVGVRPLERVIGSYAVRGPEGNAVRQEALQQYLYLGAALKDGWSSAMRAWKVGDSILTPHQTEHGNTANIGQQIAQMPMFKQHDSLANMISNTMMAVVGKSVGLPTRALGVADELMKQTVYRSKVAAAAHMEGINKGLEGESLRAFVERSIIESVDSQGRALIEPAKEEAMRATFQQDILPNTFGKMIEAGTNSWGPSKLVIPFVRTPINVFRQGIQMTPGLNVMQAEYRKMITGAMGPEMQAQAVGQMAMGSLLMGLGAYLAENDFLTGGGPSDPQQRKKLMDTGWRPYSYVRTGPNGEKQYISYGRFDPVAMPFSIIADLSDSISSGRHSDGSQMDKFAAGATALLISLSKQMSNKAYLTSINQAVDAFTDPDRSFDKFASGFAANFVPFASGLRYVNPDPLMRETRDMVDKILAQTPGFSDKLPPRRDVFGDPVTSVRSIYSVQRGDIATTELQRLIEETGQSFGAPSPTVDKVDLRDITMADGRNAYDAYQQLAARPAPGAPTIKTALTKIMETEAYRKAPDGDANLRGTKLYMLAGTIQKYHERALRQIKADPVVRKATGEAQQKVNDAYKAVNAPKSSDAQGRQSLEALGKAFGVDLAPVLNPNQ